MASSLWFARTDLGLRAWFSLVRSNGLLRTGAVAGDFTFLVISPDDTSSQEFFVTESVQKPGLYYTDIAASFLLASGTGDYGVSLEVDTGNPQRVRDAFSSIFRVNENDWDSLTGSIWDEILPGNHDTSGSAGQLLQLASATSSSVTFEIDSGSIADEVWDRVLPGNHDILNSAGAILQDSASIAFEVWEETIPGVHDTSGTAGQILQTASSGTSVVIDSGSIAAEVWDTILPGVHDTVGSAGQILQDSGSFADEVWERAGNTHLTSGTMGWLQNQIVDTLISGTGGMISSASIDNIVDAVWDEILPGEHDISGSAGNLVQTAGAGGVDTGILAAAVWDKLATDHTTTGTMGALQGQINVIRALMENNWELSGSQMVFYGDDGITPFRIYNLLDTERDPFFSEPEAPAERVLTSSLV